MAFGLSEPLMRNAAVYIEKCPLPDCLEGYSNKEDNKKFCLSRSELITVIQNIIKLVKERRRGKG